MSKYQQCLSTEDVSALPMQLSWPSFTENRYGCSRELSELLQSLLVPSQKGMLRFFLATGEHLEQRQGVAPSTAVDKVLALGAVCSYYLGVH